MSEFDTFMQLGARLEQENKMLMAYGAYAEAMYQSVGSRKNLIQSFLISIKNNISQSAKERNKELKTQLMEWIHQGELSYAVACYGNLMGELQGKEWIDADNAVLYHCLSIYQSELNCQINPFAIQEKSWEELKKWYYELKFMMRRIDMELSENQEFISYVKKEQISPVALYYMCTTMCFFQKNVYNNLALLFEEYGMEDYAECFNNLKQEYPLEQFPKEKREIPSISIQETFAFIVAVSEEEMFEEAVYYIRHLRVPEGAKVEIIPVKGASSIAQAYNIGLKKTNAKYKIYIHQDVMIVNPDFLYELYEIFEDSKIGLVGVAGVEHMPKSGIWWDNDGTGDYRKLYQDTIMEYGTTIVNEFEESYRYVEALDGVLLATQYDIPWREDIFTGWHFYDISQSMEFRRRGYQVAVAGQKKIWCLHEQKWNKEIGEDYLKERKVFLNEYKEVEE